MSLGLDTFGISHHRAEDVSLGGREAGWPQGAELQMGFEPGYRTSDSRARARDDAANGALQMSLPEILERAASALPGDADAIRPANGDPFQLLQALDVDAAARVLTWLLVNESSAGADLACAWAEEEGGLAPLQAVTEPELPKEGRKALRRALHRLRSRGVDVPKSAAEPVVARLPEIEDDLAAACVSAVDPSGSVLAFLLEPGEAGGARIFELLLSETLGVADFQVYNAGRSKARKFFRQIQADAKAGAVEVDSAALRAMIARVADAHPADRAWPRNFTTWRSRLTSAADDEKTPGEWVLETHAEAETPALRRRAEELIRDGRFGPWPASIERLSKLVGQIREQAEGRLILSDSAEQDRLDGILAAAASELFDEAYSESTRRRFLHTAFVLSKQGQEEEAAAAVAAASSLLEFPASENPVARALLEAAIAPALESMREQEGAEGSGEAEEEGSLIVEP